MDISKLIDRCLEPFSPRTVLRRVQERTALDLARQYEAAGHSRRTRGWFRPGTSANREVASGLVRLRNGSRELVRNNKYARTIKTKLVSWMVGDGITVQVGHADADFAAKAQAELDAFFKQKLDGINDFYGLQVLAAGTMVEGGDAILYWSARKGKINNRCQVFEGDYIDHGKNVERLSGSGWITQGVEYDGDGDPVALWLFDSHPGDFGGNGQSRRHPIGDIDHLFHQDRPGQARGVPWLAPVMLDIKDAGELEDAVRMKKKIEACLALILTPGEKSTPPTPFDKPEASPRPGPPIETVRPGMIYRAQPGDSASTLNPSSTGDGVDFMKQQLAAMAAPFMPYFMLTGDMRQSSYISLRAAINDFYKLLDHWQQNILIPQMVEKGAQRGLDFLWLKTGDRRYRELSLNYGLPRRPALDPVSDVQGEREEIRTGFRTMTLSLAERGMTVAQYIAERQAELSAFDAAGLVHDSDPRKVTNAGMLQQPAGYIAPKNRED